MPQLSWDPCAQQQQQHFLRKTLDFPARALSTGFLPPSALFQAVHASRRGCCHPKLQQMFPKAHTCGCGPPRPAGQ